MPTSFLTLLLLFYRLLALWLPQDLSCYLLAFCTSTDQEGRVCSNFSHGLCSPATEEASGLPLRSVTSFLSKTGLGLQLRLHQRGASVPRFLHLTPVYASPHVTFSPFGMQQQALIYTRHPVLPGSSKINSRAAAESCLNQEAFTWVKTS